MSPNSLSPIMIARASVTEEMSTIETAAETNGLCHNNSLYWAHVIHRAVNDLKVSKIHWFYRNRSGDDLF